MRRILIFFGLILIACRTASPVIQPQEGRLEPAPSLTIPAKTFLPSQSPVFTPMPPPETVQVLPSLSATFALPFSSRTPIPPRSSFETRIHPDHALYVGDLASFEVIAPDGFQKSGHKATIRLGGSEGPQIGEAEFAYFGLGDRVQATFLWVWDTFSLPAGEQVLNISILPGGPVWNETVTLLARGQLPQNERLARWATTESDCCLVHYLTNSAAERDLSRLLAMFDEQSNRASTQLDVVLNHPVEITLLPRVMGHGGFATGEINLSYLDRDYTGGETEVIFHHELVHILDARLGGELRPPFLVEGLAVFLTGGHFKVEPLLQRAAALLPPEPGCLASGGPVAATMNADGEACGLGFYIPLNELIDPFYQVQHEIGYLEAGALTAYIVENWGWPAFSTFYRDVRAVDQDTQKNKVFTSAIDAAARRHFGIGLDQLEQDFIKRLEAERLSFQWVEDVRLTLTFYDLVREYQQVFDPSAYFLYAWMPDGKDMRNRGIVADSLRRPTDPMNLVIETMLTEVDFDLRQGAYPQAERLLSAITEVLTNRGTFSADPLAADYFDLVMDLINKGYQPERIRVERDTARIWVSISGPHLYEIAYQQNQGDWIPLTVLAGD